eukprot:3688097-Amphidinium_carterae.1
MAYLLTSLVSKIAPFARSKELDNRSQSDEKQTEGLQQGGASDVPQQRSTSVAAITARNGPTTKLLSYVVVHKLPPSLHGHT